MLEVLLTNMEHLSRRTNTAEHAEYRRVIDATCDLGQARLRQHEPSAWPAAIRCLESMRQAYPPWHTTGREITEAMSREHVIIGIRREGNQCYAIAVLQLLARSPSLQQQVQAGS